MLSDNIELLGHCKGGKLNVHIWVWLGFDRNSGSIYLKELISCLSRANVCAFHENPDRLYTELAIINP